MNREMIERVLARLNDREDLVKTLKYAVEVEEKKLKEYSHLENYIATWNALEVHAQRRDIELLVYDDIVELAYKSSKHTEFKLKDRESVKEALEEYNQVRQESDDKYEIPDDLFDDIVGYDDLKKLFMKGLKVGGFISCWSALQQAERRCSYSVWKDSSRPGI